MQPFINFSCHIYANQLFKDLVLVNKFGLFKWLSGTCCKNAGAFL